MLNEWIRRCNLDPKNKSAEITLNTNMKNVYPDEWYDLVLEHYERLMNWEGVPIQEVDVQSGGDEALVEVVVRPYFPLTLEKVVQLHEQTLKNILMQNKSKF